MAVAQRSSFKPSPTSFTNVKNGVVVRHREFVGTFASTVATFQILDTFTGVHGCGDCNPTNVNSFPWLAQVAGAFEKYRFRKLRYEIVPGNPTTSSGRYWCMFDYDYNDPCPVDQRTMMNNQTAVEGNVWDRKSLVVNTAVLNSDMPYRYCDMLKRRDATEQRTTYAGYFILGWLCPIGSTFDLIVDYEVELQSPVMEPDTVVNTVSSSAQATTSLFPACGTQWAMPIGDALLGTGPIRTYPSGSSGAPTAVVAGAPLANATVFDLKSMGPAVFKIIENASATGKAPSDFDSATASIEAQVFDAAGSLLTTLDYTNLDNGKLGSLVRGPMSSGFWSTANGRYEMLMEFAVPELLKQFPTAASFIPYTKALTNVLVGAGARYSGYELRR